VSSLGVLHVVEVRGAAPEALADGAQLRALGDAIIARLGLTALGEPRWHAFPARVGAFGGHTGLWLLAESHLALHTFPESGSMTLDLHSCRRLGPLPWADLVGAFLGAALVSARIVDRDEAP
jgi:S-adenosylmethionine decarboxylase